MKDYKGFRMIDQDDIEAVREWAKTQLVAADPDDAQNVARVKLIRDTIVTGLAFAQIMAKEMGGLPLFEEGQTPEQRKAAMAKAAEISKKHQEQARRKRKQAGP